MTISGVEVTDYRNYIRQGLTLEPGINVLYGHNAQGKTNLLEAIRLCSIGRSHRTTRDRELIREGQNAAGIAIQWSKRDGSHELRCVIPSAGAKQIRIDGKPLRRSGELMGMLPSVLFAPEDLSLVKQGPAERRRFIDMELSQLVPSYYYSLQRYNRALKERNNLLKQLQLDMRQLPVLDSWDEQLVTEAVPIIERRATFIRTVNGSASKLHSHITGGAETLACEYDANIDPDSAAETLRSKLSTNRSRDIAAGTTTSGPHRDDLLLLINGKDARVFGSQGQQRTTALALKLSELNVMHDETGEWPLLLLDDVMSELDPLRRRMLLECMEGVQTIVTCTDKSDLGGARMDAVFAIEDGRAQRELT